MTYIDEEVKFVIELYLTIYIIECMCAYIRVCGYEIAEDLEQNSLEFSHPQRDSLTDVHVYIWPELD